MKKRLIAIILPTLNEEQTVGKVIDEIPYSRFDKNRYKLDVTVVDGKSNDRTIEIAKSRGAQVINEPRKGKGRAIITAFNSINADYFFFLDADYTYPATYIPEMLNLLEQGHPIVIGTRLRGKRQRGAIRLINIVGNHILTFMASLLYRNRISDLCTGYWGLRGDIVKTLNLKTDGFQIEAELFIELSKRGYPISDVPIYYRKRTGKAKLNALRDGFKIGWLLISKCFSRSLR
jgi:dolichol-phosphate mannosyltransferase